MREILLEYTCSNNDEEMKYAEFIYNSSFGLKNIPIMYEQECGW